MQASIKSFKFSSVGYLIGYGYRCRPSKVVHTAKAKSTEQLA